MTIKLVKIAPNLHRLDLPEGVSIWFSYETPIAAHDGFKLYTAKNEWSITTGKHINRIEPNKYKRVTAYKVNQIIKEIMK